jgi:hypothetical protein
MAIIVPKDFHRHFWNEERGMTSMFILLCFSNFIVTPFFSHQETIRFIVRVTWFVLLVTGITTLAETKRQIRIFSVIPILLVIVTIISLFKENRFLDYIDFITEISVFVLLIGMVLVKVFEAGKITIHRVVGSIVAYILLGDLWAVMFQFFYIQAPGSIQLPDLYIQTGPPSSVFLYFSFTTLTTTGYGEILPVHAITRTLVIIEQLIGVLYPVVLIGRLVSLVSGNKKSSDQDQNTR